MSKIYEAGDVIIKRFEMFNKSQGSSINPMDQLVGCDIFEDMSKPTLYATFTLKDNLGLISKFPIIGEEEIHFEFQSPGMSKPTLFKFRSFAVTGIKKDANGKGSVYTIRCVSEEHLYAGSSLVKESYNDTISNMIPVILSKNMMSKKELIVDPTKGVQTIVFPKLNPLAAIDMIRQRAVSKDFVSSSYVFFENQAGFNFKTIEGLMKDGQSTIGSREFNNQQNTMGSKESQAAAFRTIIQYEALSKSDSNKKAAEGIFKAVTKTFDINAKSFESKDFNLKDIFGRLQKPDKKAQLPSTDDFIDKFASRVPKQFFAPRDTSRPDNFIDAAIAARNSFAVLLNSDVTRVLVHGDTGLKVGDMVKLNLTDASGTTDRKKQDKMTSGNYLVVRLRHMVTLSTKTKHEIVFDCVRMGI
jgi:hypothetical protein